MATPAQVSEGLCLKFPKDLGIHPQLSTEQAVTMLGKAAMIATQQPFVWGFIDKPQEGSIFLVFLPLQQLFPNDGIRYFEQEQKYPISLPGGKELETHEIRYGFVPSSNDTHGWRVRRRYRLIQGGHPQLLLIHYSRGEPMTVPHALLTSPIRTYPLRQVTEPPVYIAGERSGLKANVGMPQGGGGPGPMGGGGPMVGGGPMGGGGPGPMGMAGGMRGGPPMAGMSIHQQQAMLAQQNNNMAMMEREQKRREAMAAQQQQRPPPPGPPRPEEIEDIDEADFVSTRSLALARYRRNHDFMNDIFRHAAYGGKHTPSPPKAHEAFDLPAMEEKVAKLEQEIEALKSRKLRGSSMEVDVAVA